MYRSKALNLDTEALMNRLMKKIEEIMVAVTFAEAGEYDEACRLAGSDSEEQMTKPLEELKQTALEHAGK